MSDVEMQDADKHDTAAASMRLAATDADATEKKKALLVYKSHQHSASDDDDDDDDDEEDDDDDEEDDDLDAAPAVSRRHNDDIDVSDDDDLDDAASVKSDVMARAAGHDDDDDEDADDDVDDDDDDSGVHVEKDDDESIDAPSDDDLDSTAATPTRLNDSDDDDDDDDERRSVASGATTPINKLSNNSSNGDVDAQSTTAGATTAATPAPATTTALLKSGDLSAIIAARRRTGARKECEVCGEHRNGRRAMLCTACKGMFHSSCFRQRYNRLISHAQGKQWTCPECDPAAKVEAVEAAAVSATTTPRKKGSGDSNKSRAARNAAKQAALAAARALLGNDAVGSNGSGASSGAPTSLLPADAELKRVTAIALRSSKTMNTTVLERTDEMLEVVKSLTAEIESVGGTAWRSAAESTKTASAGATGDASAVVKPEQSNSSNDCAPPPFTLPVASSSSSGAPLAQRPLSPVAHSPSNDFKRLSTNTNSANSSDAVSDERDVLLTRVHGGLCALKNLLEQLQVTGIQFEVDVIKEITMPTAAASSNARRLAASSTTSTASAAAAAARANALANKAKNGGGASRLYSSKQIAKLEDWYQKSSRPESIEIHAMFRLINCPEYADKDLQPDGISIKQIRIWFDNRRAKERLDYMRLKMKDVSTAGLDSETIKRMKAAFIDEAKEVLEARVSRKRESLTGPGEIVDEAGDLLLGGTGDPSLLPSSTKLKVGGNGSTQYKPMLASPTVIVGNGTGAGGGSSAYAAKAHTDAANKSCVNVKKRIRVDFVASVRKVVKEARDAGKSEEEVKALRAAAIDRARERLHVPYKNARQGPLKPLGKDEVTHIKMKMLKLLEEDAAPEELTDVIELLMSVMIPREILIESALHRQLTLVLKAYKDSKELLKQTNKLLDEYNLIVEKGDSVFDPYLGIATTDENGVLVPPIVKKPAPPRRKKPTAAALAAAAAAAAAAASSGGHEPSNPLASTSSTPSTLRVETASLAPATPSGGALSSPDSAAASSSLSSPENRRPRVKFSLEQLVKLEKHFYKDDTPSKAQLDKLAHKLNAIGARDAASDDAQRAIDYKQIRCWFYKRRSTNQRPQALTSVDLQNVANNSSPSETESDSDSDSGDNSSDTVNSHAKARGSSKRKATDARAAPAAKRSKSSSDAKPRASSKKDSKASTSSGSMAGAPPPGRVFNVKQLATIIEEYEKNPRPSAARMNELQHVLNADEHADDHGAAAASAAGVTTRQIKTWFSHRRAKERQDLIKMKGQDIGSRISRSRDLDSVDSETEDDERDSKQKKKVPKADASKQTAKARDGVVMDSNRDNGEDDDELSSDDVESDRSAAQARAAAAAAVTTAAAARAGAKPSMSMSMLVDDDDDSDDNDDDDLDDDSDDDDAA